MLKRLDPFHLYLILIHKVVDESKLDKKQQEFVQRNVAKHTLVQWINLACALDVVWALFGTPPDSLGTVAICLMTPVLVIGGAWFAITFGLVPADFMSISMHITGWMYLGFKISLTAMLLTLGYVMGPRIYPFIGILYIALDVAGRYPIYCTHSPGVELA